MRQRAGWIGVGVFVALVLAFAYASWRVVRASDEVCSVCRRPVHAHSRTVGMLGNRRVVFCCPACAMSEEQQAAGVRITAFTDYATGAKIAPAQAWLVRGSDVNPCLGRRSVMDADKHTAPMHFDRCVPGLMAFARREDAARFIGAHGGEMVSPPAP